MYPKPLYKMSGEELEAAAKSGANAELLLAVSALVANGWRGLAEDEDRALELEKMAAALGHPRALCEIGNRFARGRVVDANPAEARAWWRRAAEAGDVDAMENLVELRGSDDAREAAEGAHWLQVAAQRGDPYAVHQLTGAPIVTGTELSWQRDVVATVAQANDLAGMFVERLRTQLADVHTEATIDDEPADFPQPDIAEIESLVAEDNWIEVMVYAGPHHLQLDLNPDGESWSLQLTSYEPHPSPREQAWITAQLLEAVRDAGIR